MNDIIKLTYQREGEEIKIMEFKWVDIYMGESCWYKALDHTHTYKLRLNENGFEIYRLENDKELGFNPLYLEFITLEECNQCAGSGMYDYDSYKKPRKCMACTDGNVKVVTQKVLFKPDEYDKDIWETGHDVGFETGIKLHEEGLKKVNKWIERE